MKKAVIQLLLLVLAASEAFAQERADENFVKGFYLGVEAAGGMSFNDRMENWNYGMDISAGYRFCPQFVIAGGVGGYSYANRTGLHGKTVQTTSLPVFVRFRSDILDRRVSPYVQVDLGYSFLFLSSRDAGTRIRINDEVFMDRVYALGYGSLEEYREAFLDSSGADGERLWQEELSRLKQFSNGESRYIAMDDSNVQYGKKGLFGSLDLGVSWKVGVSHRMNAGISASLAQSYYGTCLRTTDNEFLKFGRAEHLPHVKGEGTVYVRTVGMEDFIDSFDLDVRIKIGFSF